MHESRRSITLEQVQWKKRKNTSLFIFHPYSVYKISKSCLNSQSGFIPGRGTTDAIFVVRQLQEKYLAANKRLYMAFVDLEKAFDLGKSSGGSCENLVWRSGLYYWCRGCMQMHGAVSMLLRGTVKSLKWRSVFTKAQYSAHFSSSLCLKPYHENSALGSPGRTSMLMTLLSLLNRSRNVSEALDLERSNGKERTKSKCRKDEDHDLQYGPGPPAGTFPCAICCTGVGSNSIFCNGCKYWVHRKCSGLKHLTLTTRC